MLNAKYCWTCVINKMVWIRICTLIFLFLSRIRFPANTSIAVNSVRAFFKMDEQREDTKICSKWCKCHSADTPLQCTSIGCVTDDPQMMQDCDDAAGNTYKFGWKAFLPHRGLCMCYGGNFICQRPLNSAFMKEEGVYWPVATGLYIQEHCICWIHCQNVRHGHWMRVWQQAVVTEETETGQFWVWFRWPGILFGKPNSAEVKL